MAWPGSLVFRGRGDRRPAHSLLGLVDDTSVIDGARLAPWIVRAPPNTLTETPYADVDVAYELAPVAEADVAPAPSRLRLDEAPAFLRRALEKAVDDALHGVRRVAVMTGGGLDSSILLGLATQWAARTGASVFAVALDFEGAGDDRPHLAALERHLGCEVVRVTPEEAAPRSALLATGIDGVPVPFASMPMEIELLARARAHGAERVLSGGGADELFSGNPYALSDIAWRGEPLAALRAARRLTGFHRPRVPAWSWVMRPLLGRALPQRLRAWRGRRTAPYFAPSWAGPVARRFVDEKRRAVGARPVPRSARARFAAVRDDGHRVVLAWGRHLEEQASGIECSEPYLDPALALAVSSLRPDYLLFGDRWRGLLREAASDLLPATLRDRMDKARFEPALRRFTDATGGLASLDALGHGRALAALGLVEPAAFRSAYERFVATPDDGRSWVTLWSALSVEAFLRGRVGHRA